jgi:hypothetical protein
MGKILRLSSKPTKGWSSMVMRAATRNFPWKDIASELIDNSLANIKPGQVCQVEVAWDTKLCEFSVSDRGRGCGDLESFFRPGKSGGNHGPMGNSTFGTGLFAIECYLDCNLQVVTQYEREIQVGYRTISDEGSDGNASGESLRATARTRKSYGLSEEGGTLIRFRGFRKRSPSHTEMERIAAHLSFAYSAAIEQGALRLTLRFNGTAKKIKPTARPKLLAIKRAKIEEAGHIFEVEWGITEKSVENPGCRLIYGGKTFDVTSRPCGKGRLARFFAAITIPRSAGLQSMDLLKKTAEFEFLDPLFKHCHKLFQAELEEADRLCGDDLNREISDTISQLLSRQRAPLAATPKGKKPPQLVARRVMAALKTALEQEPARTRRAPDKVLIEWINFGRPMPLAKYDHESRRLAYNQDNDTLVRLRSEGKVYELASVAAGYIAYEIDRQNPNQRLDMDIPLYDEIYRKLIERAAFAELGLEIDQL